MVPFGFIQTEVRRKFSGSLMVPPVSDLNLINISKIRAKKYRHSPKSLCIRGYSSREQHCVGKPEKLFSTMLELLTGSGISDRTGRR